MKEFSFVRMMAVVVAVSHNLLLVSRADEMSNLAATNFDQSIHPRMRIESRRLIRTNDQPPDEERMSSESILPILSKVSGRRIPERELVDLEKLKAKLADTETHNLMETKGFNPENQDHQLQLFVDFETLSPPQLESYLSSYGIKGIKNLKKRFSDYKSAISHVNGIFDASEQEPGLSTALHILKDRGVTVDALELLAAAGKKYKKVWFLGGVKNTVNDEVANTYRNMVHPHLTEEDITKKLGRTVRKKLKDKTLEVNDDADQILLIEDLNTIRSDDLVEFLVGKGVTGSKDDFKRLIARFNAFVDTRDKIGVIAKDKTRKSLSPDDLFKSLEGQQVNVDGLRTMARMNKKYSIGGVKITEDVAEGYERHLMHAQSAVTGS